MRNNDAKHVFLMLKDFPKLRDWLFKKAHLPQEIKGIEDELKTLREDFHK